MKPPISYFGGKTTLAPQIAALLPPHRHYVEPYCGSLAVLLAKAPSEHETVNDLDDELMNFWRVCRDRLNDLERVAAFTPHSRAEHAAAYETPPALDDLERARRVWVQLTQGRAGTRRRTGWRHYQAGVGSHAMPDYLDGYLARLPSASARLRRVSLECMPALDLIAKYGRDDDTLLYLDPPYLGDTRSSGGYMHEMTDPGEHRALAEALHICRAAVVLSGYPSDLYDLELYPDWHRVTFASGTGQNAQTWANRIEVLWSNRPLGTQPGLFDLT